jgi:ligand-binding SRPBCC domain-containing protein
VLSASPTKEQAVGGVTSGLIGDGEEVEWRAKHFGLWLKMRVRITGWRPPQYFQDSMVEGPFHSFRHDHNFEAQGSKTLMVDRIVFHSPILLLGGLADRLIVRHIQGFVGNRNAKLKLAAESRAWQPYLQIQHP